MRVWSSTIGWIFAAIYLVLCIVLIVSQGLFGESFVALLLGLPWSLLMALFEYGSGNNPAFIYILVFVPLVINTLLLYWVGLLIQQRKILRLLALIATVLVFVGLVFGIAYKKNSIQNPPPVSTTPQQVTVIGTYICLPHTNTSGPQTLECAFGLQTTDGKYYALDFNRVGGAVPNISMGQQVTVSGLLTPLEMLSSDHWRQYPITGILSVTP